MIQDRGYLANFGENVSFHLLELDFVLPFLQKPDGDGKPHIERDL